MTHKMKKNEKKNLGILILVSVQSDFIRFRTVRNFMNKEEYLSIDRTVQFVKQTVIISNLVIIRILSGAEDNRETNKARKVLYFEYRHRFF